MKANIYVSNIEQETITNNFYRKVVFTSDNQQLVLMNIKPGEDVEFEVHANNDQFIRIEQGTGTLIIGSNKEKSYDLFDGISAIIPANTWHQIINTSINHPLKLYTIYSPPHHPTNHIDVDRPCSKKLLPLIIKRNMY